jgi:transcriptional regulator with XRE-family HTH domain
MALMTDGKLREWVTAQIGPTAPYHSNVAMAKAAGVSEGTIRRMKRGETPKVATIRQMAERLNYPLEKLLATDSPEKTETVDLIDSVVSDFSAEDQEDVLQFALWIRSRRKR